MRQSYDERCEALKTRIAVATQQHKGRAGLVDRLVRLRAMQLRSEVRAERREQKR